MVYGGSKGGIKGEGGEAEVRRVCVCGRKGESVAGGVVKVR